MKPFARKFYNSKAWKKCREQYFNKVFGICELCEKPGEEVHHEIFLTPQNINDPNVTLNEENLILLCKICHNAQHEKAYNMHRAKMRKIEATRSDLCFDCNGDLVFKKNVFIVWGAPGSGKTTFVKERLGKYDIVFDLDYIVSAMTLFQQKKINEDALPFAQEFRSLFYQMIEERRYYFENAWIIGMLPKKEEREKLKARLNAELIYMEVTIDECKNRVKLDEERYDKRTQYKLIDWYFGCLEM